MIQKNEIKAFSHYNAAFYLDCISLIKKTLKPTFETQPPSVNLTTKQKFSESKARSANGLPSYV